MKDGTLDWSIGQIDTTRLDLINWIEAGDVDVLLPSLSWLTVVRDQRLATALSYALSGALNN